MVLDAHPAVREQPGRLDKPHFHLTSSRIELLHFYYRTRNGLLPVMPGMLAARIRQP
jgi:hypothetical protein